MSNLKMYTITEDEVTEATLKSLESDKNGVIDYPILEFDERALNLLCTGIHETLKCSNVNPVGGYIYKAVKRVTDFLVSLNCFADTLYSNFNCFSVDLYGG